MCVWEDVAAGSGVKLQSGTLAAWNAGRRQSRWELPAAVWQTVSLLRTHSLTLPSPISEHKVWGPSCVTKMKQAKTTLSEPGTTYIEAHMKAREPLKVVKRPLHSAGSGGLVNLSDSCTHHKVSGGSFD